SYEPISLTSKGIEEAKKVYDKHHILKKFFEKVLDISTEEAGENACKIEHIISQNILNKMISLTNFYEKNPDIIEKYKKEQTK
ncbi:MAG: hypothetical protein K2F57_07520, partial [Candidatus Gastranaerophilales bacterium]|nr:hypothetical protein [Candidatus Gastranaerophilales bacterium]